MLLCAIVCFICVLWVQCNWSKCAPLLRLPDIGVAAETAQTQVDFKLVWSLGAALLGAKVGHWWSRRGMESKSRAHEDARDKYR